MDLKVPGPKQAAATERLMKGYSSFRHQSAPSSLGGGLAGQLAARPGQPQYQLSSTAEDGECAVRLASAVAYAKQWRRRVEDSRHKRFNSTVVLKPKTFNFEENDGGGGGDDWFAGNKDD